MELPEDCWITVDRRGRVRLWRNFTDDHPVRFKLPRKQKKLLSKWMLKNVKL